MLTALKENLLLTVTIAVSVLWSGSGIAADRQNGRDIYETYCVACHGEGGNPVDPTTPNFANGDRLFQMDFELLGRIRSGNETMPAFRGILSDNDIRDVISYLRTF